LEPGGGRGSDTSPNGHLCVNEKTAPRSVQVPGTGGRWM